MTNTDLERMAARIGARCDVAVILGSGLGAFADTLANSRAVNARELEGYPASTVAGHAGRVVTGAVGNVSVLVFQGRVHLYEGYAPEKVAIPVRLAHRLGTRVLIVTNAAGALTRRFHPGDLMLIADHINLQFRTPLRALWKAGLRRPKTSVSYDSALCSLAEQVAQQERIALRSGVLAAVSGPCYETRAEARMLARLGADAACMSTVPEVLTAVALGLRVLGFSCITNFAANIAEAIQDHAEVQRVAAAATDRLCRLLRAVIENAAPML